MSEGAEIRTQQNAPLAEMHPPPLAAQQGAPPNSNQQIQAPLLPNGPPAPTTTANKVIQPGAQIGQLNQQAGFDMAAFLQAMERQMQQMERLMQQQMQLQMDLMERKMTQMVNTFNNVMGQVAMVPIVPNAPGRPLTSATTTTATTTPAPGSASAAPGRAVTTGDLTLARGNPATPHNSAVTPPQVLGAGAALSSINPPAATGPQTNAAIRAVTQALSTNEAFSLVNTLMAVNTPGSLSSSSAQLGTVPMGNIKDPQGIGGGLTGVPSHFSLPPPNYRITAPAQAVSGPIMTSHYTLPFGQQQILQRATTNQVPAECRNQKTTDHEQVNLEEYDPNDGYALNREREEAKTCKNLHIADFSTANKEQDFFIWVQQFEDAVNRALNPHSKRKHEMLCLQWISNSLKPDAYTIYMYSEHRRSDWTKLKQELEQAFEDPAIRVDWTMNPRAYSWDEKIPLQSYCAKVKHYVDTFESNLAECPAAIKGQYYQRFVNGLPEDYVDQLRLNMPTRNTSINKALGICLRWQSSKEDLQVPPAFWMPMIMDDDTSSEDESQETQAPVATSTRGRGNIKTPTQVPRCEATPQTTPRPTTNINPCTTAQPTVQAGSIQNLQHLQPLSAIFDDTLVPLSSDERSVNRNESTDASCDITAIDTAPVPPQDQLAETPRQDQFLATFNPVMNSASVVLVVHTEDNHIRQDRAHQEQIVPPPRSPSSQGTSPDATQNTVVHVSPARNVEDQMEDQNFIATLPDQVLDAVAPPENPPPTHHLTPLSAAEIRDRQVLAGQAIPNPVDCQLRLFTNVGNRKIDIIIYKNYEYRRDRRQMSQRRVQRWVCRHAQKHDCKSVLKLIVPNLEDPSNGSSVDHHTEHNHYPDPRDFDAEESNNDESHNHPGSDNAHAISRISEGDFSRDFHEEALEDKLQSSPIAHRLNQPRPTSHVDEAGASGTSASFVETSQRDVRGYVVHKKKGKQIVSAPAINSRPLDNEPIRLTDRAASPVATTSQQAS